VEEIDHSEAFDALLARRNADGERPAEDLRALLLNEEDRELLWRTFFRERDGFVREPLLFYRREAHIDRWQRNPEHPGGRHRVRTNDLGMRNDADVLAEKPDLRILVTGDSHTEGVCANDESFTWLLGQALREARPGETVEALNAGTGGYNAYHYLGVLQRYVELEPDVFVAVFYGGNDWVGAAKFQRFFLRQRPPARGPLEIDEWKKAGIARGGLASQELGQRVYFLNNPEDVERSIFTGNAIAAEMKRICDEHGIALVCVYLPPPLRGQPQYYPDELAILSDLLGERADEPDPTDTIADAWLAFLAEQGIPSLDLRPAFRAAEEHLYWERDAHIDLEGHALVARLLLPLVQGALE
jgi:lysophospholipase L1-like esterase